MAIDAGTAAIIGVGGTTLAALMGVMANLRLGRETANVNRAQLERQSRADDDAETDRAFVRLEKENERLTEALAAERAAHEQTRQELLASRNEGAQLRAENTVLSVGLVAPPQSKAAAKRPAGRKKPGTRRDT